MNCAEARDRIHRRIDGELSAGEEAELEAHLRACPACREADTELTELAGIVAEIARTDRVETPAPPDAGRGGVRRRRRVYGLAAAAVLLFALGLFALVERLGPRRDGRPPVEVPHAVVAEATLEVSPEDADSFLVVQMPSRQDDVHIFWLYATEHRKE